jgi:predicted phage terminase large subunit-like protein
MAKKELSADKMQQAINLIDQLACLDAREDFWKFCKYVDPVFFNDKKQHLRLIASKLQAVADGKIRKLAVSLPPRAGKSYIISMFCAWTLGRYPLGSIMRNSYSATLAEKFSKDIRDGILIHTRFKKVFPNVRLSKKNTAVEGWSIEGNTQPSYFCAGVGGSITGFGCRSLAILDDPIKNIEEALSETVIEGVWNWYTSTHLSRLETGCPEIHIATRWSKRDPIGRLTDPDSEFYVPDMDVVLIPALDKHGNSFCEEIKTTAEYHEIRRITDTFIWEAEFMQNPVEEKGLLYFPGELKRFAMNEIATKTPDGVVGFTDTADLGSDFLCSIIGQRFGDYTYITDVVFTQDGVEITEPLVADLIIRSKCQVMKVESNNGGRQFKRNVKKLVEGKSFCSIIDETQTKNKETRILMQSGYVKEYFYFRNDYAPGSDYDKFFRQFTSFVKLGRNTHDDACDAVTGLAEYIPYRHFDKPRQTMRDDLGAWREDDNTNYLSGEETSGYLNFMEGNYAG